MPESLEIGGTLRILLLTHNVAGLGGSYMRSFSLARQLAGFGHAVSLLASRRVPGLRTQTIVRDKVDVVEMPDVTPERLRHGGLSPLDALGRMLWVSRRSFDVIHAFDHRPAVSLPALVGKARGALLVSDWADLWGRDGIGGERRDPAGRLLAFADDAWEARFRRRVDGVSVISRALWDRLERLGVAESRRMLLPPGANVDLIRPLPKSEARRHFGLPAEAHIVVSTGFSPYDEALTATALAEVLAADREARVVTSGWRNPRLRGAAARGSFQDRLTMLGSVPLAELGKVLACADVLLLPFSARPVNLPRFPNRFGDFLAAGRPIVTNRTGDLGELVTLHRLGVVAEEDPAEMARAVVELFGDRRRAEDLGRRGRVFAEEHLNWEILARGAEGFYRGLLGAVSGRDG